MNHIYRLVWNAITACWVAVCETAKGRGKGSLKGAVKRGSVTTAAGLLVLLTPLAQAQSIATNALPTGAQTISGASTSTQAGANLTINQTSNNLITNWQTFNIGSAARVQFVQPTTASVALNRVVGQDPTQILGSLQANGHVMLVNPQGIVFGAGSQINVGALTASTLNITDADFATGVATGRYNFGGTNLSQNPALATATVNNQGRITTANGGTVALIAPVVQNSGSITATQGAVALAASDQVTLDLAPAGSAAGLLKVTLGKAQLDALVKNTGSIQADGGTIILTAAAVGGLYNAVVNNEGQLRAQTLQNVAGRIMLLADFDTGTVKAAGSVDASAPNGGDGGFVDTSAATVQIKDDFRVTTNAPTGKTGLWLIDPTDFVIAATSGDISGATLGSSLNTGGTGITITNSPGAGNGDIFVNDTVTWTSANTLSLTANRNIDFTGGGRLNASNAGSQVNLTATSGSIVGHASNTVVTTGTLVATAANGIGSASRALNTKVQRAALTNLSNGGIYVTNTGDVVVAAASTNGGITIKTADGVAGAEGADGFGGSNGQNGTAGAAGGHITVSTVATGSTSLNGITVSNTGNVLLQAGGGGGGGDRKSVVRERVFRRV